MKLMGGTVECYIFQPKLKFKRKRKETHDRLRADYFEMSTLLFIIIFIISNHLVLIPES